MCSGLRAPPSEREAKDLGETGDKLSQAGLQLKSKFTPDFPWAVFEAAAQKLKVTPYFQVLFICLHPHLHVDSSIHDAVMCIHLLIASNGLIILSPV